MAGGIPPFLQIVSRLPIFSTGHNSRLIPWYMIALALLAAWGLDDLRSGRLESERPRRLALLLGIPLLIPVVFVLARDVSITSLCTRCSSLPGPSIRRRIRARPRRA